MVRSPECTACLECVSICPTQGALGLSLSGMFKALKRKKALPAWAMGLAIAALFFGIVGFAKMEGYWKLNISTPVYKHLIPHAGVIAYPILDNPPSILER